MYTRSSYTVIGLAALSAVGLAVYLQELWQLSACTLCILQRYLYLALAGFSFLRAFLPAGGWRITGLAAVCGLAGAAVATRNIWVIYVPSLTCGRDKLASFVNALPTAQYWPTLFEANGLCSDSPANVAGIPFPILSLLAFLTLTACVIAAHKLSARTKTSAA
jgi:disulfide bond formation protein DsbB